MSVALVGGQSAHATLVAGWDFQTTTNGGTAVAASPNTPQVFVANFGSGTLYLDGSNYSSVWSQTGDLNAFGGTTINAGSGFAITTSGPAALALLGGTAASANGKYGVFKFDMTGYQDLAVSYASQRSSYSFSKLTWDASTDGTNWTTVGTIAAGTSYVASGTLALSTISLLDNSSTAYLRFSGTGALTSSGNNRLDNIQFNANAYVALTGTATWVGTGAGGIWSNGGSGNFGTPFSNSLSTAVIFTATGETVTLSGGIQAGSLSFQPSSGSYTLTGGSSLELGAGVNASVASGVTATVNSVIAGSNGLTKAGAGTLVLGGANAFTGNVSVNAGTVQLAADSALGDATNDLRLAGTLKTTASIAMGSDRDVSGAGTLDIAPGTKLSSSGLFDLTSTTLASAGTLDLQGATRSVGVLTFGTAARVDGAGAISLNGITATAVTTGSAVINPAITFTSSGDKTIDVGSGGALVLNGDIAGTTGRIAKTGLGTVIINGANSTGGLRIGASAATPTPGGTVVLAASQASGTSQMQLNAGTLTSTVLGGVTIPAGVSVGGRANGVAVIGGSQPLTFSGSSSFYRSFGTSGELRLDVNNATTIAGVLGATTGPGSSTGVTIGGTGRLILTASGLGATGNTSFTDRVTVNSGATLEIANETALAAAPLNTSGDGTITFGVPAATVASIDGTGTIALKNTSNAPIVLTLTQAASGTYAGGFSGPGSVVKYGDSTLALTGASTHAGTTSVQQGRLQIANVSALGVSTLTVANSATASVASSMMATAGGLNLAATGLVDLATGGMTIGTSSPVSIVARILEGRGDGFWTGSSGITSTQAAADLAAGIPRTVGWLANGDGSVTFAYAAPGDTNLDWTIDMLDVAAIVGSGKFGTGAAATWRDGDSNYDGLLDMLDVAALMSTDLFDAGIYNAAQASAVAAVPEPSTWAMALASIACGGYSLFRRRHAR